MLASLFLSFLKIGCISFGGGYAVIPMIEREVRNHHWLGEAQFQEIVSLSGMAPGPIATNSATLIGYQAAGVGGAIAATAGMVLPSLVIVILISAFFWKVHHSEWVRSSFYGLKPTITGLIIYAAVHFGFLTRSESFFTWSTLATIVICAGCLYGVLNRKMHPIAVIVASGFAGIILL
jgi:chromate transporter